MDASIKTFNWIVCKKGGGLLSTTTGAFAVLIEGVSKGHYSQNTYDWYATLSKITQLNDISGT